MWNRELICDLECECCLLCIKDIVFIKINRKKDFILVIEVEK